MGRLLSWLGAKAKALLGLILPMFQKARSSGGLSSWLRTILHVLIVLFLLATLFWINWNSAWIQSAIPHQELLRKSWLPILFLLLYTLCWLSYWLWRLLVSEDEGLRFPDIEEAWEEAKASLRQAGLNVSDAPLFLFLGQPEDEEKALFQAAQINLVVKQAPTRDDAPLYVYASRDAIYLTCAGASLLGRHARHLAGKLRDKTMPDREEAPSEEDDMVTNTISPGGSGSLEAKGPFADMAKVLHQAEREGRPLTKAEKRELRRMYRQGQPQRSPLKDPELIAYEAARLQFLCRLLVRDRRPFCAVNGVLLLVPFAGTDSEQDATYTAEALQRDLAVTASALQVDCPHYALVCDLETASGFSEFLQRFAPKERLRRLGQSCPLSPDLQGSSLRAAPKDATMKLLDSLAKWVCQSVVPIWVYRKFQMEKADTPDRTALNRTNGRLFLLADELQERSGRLATVLVRGLTGRTGPLLFGGCYLAATGSNAEREQAFVRGLLDRLSEGQSCVYWTQQTLDEEASYARWVRFGWTFLAMVVLTVLCFACYLRLK
ncbi:MAG TPA: type VI secretion protein IcmF/TssM N-terminal domain-containing protein [Gemmataceae bacterium]